MAEGGGDLEIVKDHFDPSSKKDRTSTSNSPGSSQINILAPLSDNASKSVTGIIKQFEEYERTIKELKEENSRLRKELEDRPIRKQDPPIGLDACDGHFDGNEGASQDTPTASPVEGLTADGDRNTSSSVVPGRGSTSENISGTSLTGENEVFIKQEMTFAKENSVSLMSSVSNPSLDSKTSTSAAQDSTLQHAHIQFMVDQLDVGVWPSYMRALGMVERDLETIRHDYVGVKEQQYQAFLKWIDRVGKKATPEKLIKVALKRKLRLIAERFCKEFPDYHYILESESEKKQLKKTASNPSLQSIDVSESLSTLSLSSIVSHTGNYSSLSSMNDQAVPNYQSYEPTPRQSAAVSMLTSNSLFIRVLQPYMQNPNDTNKFYHEIFSQPFTVQSRAVFQRNVLEYQKEVNFQTLVSKLF
ncbi:hypothetical protein BSL78_19817 [Apostichopus japonicus]|uniref:Death domain-containing protein n=1 Tax=Stichopus japonicus TaxID=307972 RepID=A0A2G8K5N6_STIJA|nr:hypothetical protein BSL78_19817 [Apostichopus japonicus]